MTMQELKDDSKNKKTKTNKRLFRFIKKYIPLLMLLIVLTVASNGLNLIIPKIISRSIDLFNSSNFKLLKIITEFFIVSISIFILGYFQSILQTFISEKVAKDIRSKLINKISKKEYVYIQNSTSAKFLTNLTSDVDAIKTFVSQALSSIFSSLFLIVGVGVILFLINWKLALVVISLVPVLLSVFFLVFKKIKHLFKKTQETIDWLNKVINESILGSAIIRLLNSQQQEYLKFLEVNSASRDIGFSIVKLISTLLPLLNFVVNFVVITIIVFGGHLIILNDISLGDFSAFYNYLFLLIFPVIMLGFVSNSIAQAVASYGRICEVLDSPDSTNWGDVMFDFSDNIELKNLSLKYNEKYLLNNISLKIEKNSKTAILGPTAAGKSQLFYLLSGLIQQTSGEIFYDGLPIKNYNKASFYNSIGFVFQDSVMFNLTLRENIAFSNSVKEEDLQKAINTAELKDFIASLKDGLDTVITERGLNLSGGQKQRIMLARALAVNPKILFLDDFTARIDNKTEGVILDNLKKNYPAITLISITQKISPIKDYDQIILLMEGELLAIGKHEDLLNSSEEYAQIYNSQNSINNYELHS